MNSGELAANPPVVRELVLLRGASIDRDLVGSEDELPEGPNLTNLIL
jgi:hypothetical protein